MSEDQNRGERLQIMLSPEELKVLDDFRFKVRMPSRAAAVRELLKRGLAAEGYSLATHGSKSSDFGVLAKADGDGKASAGVLAKPDGDGKPSSGRRPSGG